MRNLELAWDFSLMHVWSWGFAYSEIQPQWQAEKYSHQIKIGESIRNLSFPVRNLHIVCGSLATQHARWHKNISLRGGQAVPTSHISSAHARTHATHARTHAYQGMLCDKWTANYVEISGGTPS